MLSIFKKEIHSFFSSIVGYLAMLIFIIACGLFLWVVPSSSILDFGYASMDRFFELAPWFLLLLIPSVTMRAFAEEFRTGTIEWLSTKPIATTNIVLGKYFAILVILLFVILPTLVYIIAIKALSTQGGIDGGGILGSYIGLFFLGAVFAAISLCCSGFTNNAVVAFLISVFGCIILYFGFNALSKLPLFENGVDYYVEMLGIDFHYSSISRGVLDSRDVVYFFSIIFLFLLVTVKTLSKK